VPIVKRQEKLTPFDTKTDPLLIWCCRHQREPHAGERHSDPKLHGDEWDMVSRRAEVLGRAVPLSSSVAIDSSRLGSWRVTVMEQASEIARRGRRRQRPRPIASQLVGRDQEGAAFVPWATAGKEMRAAPLEGQVAELVDERSFGLGVNIKRSLSCPSVSAFF